MRGENLSPTETQRKTENNIYGANDSGVGVV